ncbi:nitrogenase component 1 [Mobilibacterium timonense]|uniref:nitrogenase component 1 n=1 Tax=Mobilibacterium timonense TaxID=1871012 RepID=UPI0013564AE9|nr:nitrogenase component 1 [Mobilibacterium timonense]
MRNLFHKLPGFAADYSGAMMAVSHMRCLRILHGQGGCSGGVCTCDDYESETDDWRTLFSKISEIETITGNDEKLVEMIADATDSTAPDWLLLLGSPIPMIIATDYRAIASKVEEKTGIPSLFVDTTGIETYDAGESKVYRAMIERAERIAPSGDQRHGTVYVIGDTPLNGWTEKMREDYGRDILRNADGAVEVVFAGGGEAYSFGEKGDDITVRKAGMGDWKAIDRSSLNIAVSASAYEAVRKLENSFGTPYRYFGTGHAWENMDMRSDPQTEACEVRSFSDEKILLVGEQFLMNNLRRYLRRNFGARDVAVVGFFAFREEFAEDGDETLNDEDDYMSFLERTGPYDVVLGDPVLQPMGGYLRSFISCPELALSSRLLTRELPVLYGRNIGEIIAAGQCNGDRDR